LGPVVELGSGDGASRRPRLIGSASFNNLARGGQHRVQRPGWRARPGVAEGPARPVPPDVVGRGAARL